jgi:hypothetical protein
LLLAAIGATERTLRRHRGLCEATIRLGRRSYKVRNADAAPRRDAALISKKQEAHLDGGTRSFDMCRRCGFSGAAYGTVNVAS